MRAKGWVGFAWPKEFGGSDGGLIEQAILKEEMSLAKAPPLGTSMMGLAWVGPGIMEYGTEEQKKKFIPDILDSKVTGVRVTLSQTTVPTWPPFSARPSQGDHYLVNGQKIWTTGAPWSQWIILLTRTDFNVTSKHDGITCFLVPMDAPGVEFGDSEYGRRQTLCRDFLH